MKKASDRSKRRNRGGASASAGAFETYTEREVWSQRFKSWRLFDTGLPRLPRDGETMEGPQRWVNMREHLPLLVALFAGMHIDGVKKALKGFKDSFDNDKQLPDILILSGPPGSGNNDRNRFNIWIFVQFIVYICRISPLLFLLIPDTIYVLFALSYTF